MDIQSTTSYEVTLPCPPEDFKEFVSNLLGKPQTLTKIFRGSFEVGKTEIKNLHHLIIQRVAQQNKSFLAQFRCRIVFDDNSSILLNSFEDFETFNEVKPLISTQIHLNWTFLVIFEDKKVPEKQEIQVSYITGSFENGPYIDEDSVIIFKPGIASSKGAISIRIEHTARTWGSDILSLLTGHIENNVLPVSKFRSFLATHSGKISFTIALCIFISAVYASLSNAKQICISQLSKAQPFIGSSKTLNEKIDLLISVSTSGLWARYVFGASVFLIFMLFISILIGVWVESSADSKKASFLLLTQKSEKNKIEVLKKYENKFVSFVASILTSIGCGVISSIIFESFWK
jgi:hypothetical protein